MEEGRPASVRPEGSKSAQEEESDELRESPTSGFCLTSHISHLTSHIYLPLQLYSL